MFRGLLNKSALNSNAAEILNSSPNYHYCSSIHCAYYSCLQMLRYILFEVFKEDEDKIFANRSTGIIKKGEHEYFIDKIHEDIIKSNKIDLARDYKNK